MNQPITEKVILDQPITRGSTEITEILVRKPNAGELRGTQIANLLQMDVTALTLVLPRITQPILTKQDVEQMDLGDFTQLAMVLSGFLLPRTQREAALSLA